MPMGEDALFQRIGGEGAVDATVEAFYVKILADDRIKDLFVNTDMPKQKGMQKKFLTFAFGGPNNYAGKGMRDAHATINDGKPPTEEHFGAVAECLVGTLKDLGVAQDLIDEVVTIAVSVKADVLGQ